MLIHVLFLGKYPTSSIYCFYISLINFRNITDVHNKFQGTSHKIHAFEKCIIYYRHAHNFWAHEINFENMRNIIWNKFCISNTCIIKFFVGHKNILQTCGSNVILVRNKCIILLIPNKCIILLQTNVEIGVSNGMGQGSGQPDPCPSLPITCRVLTRWTRLTIGLRFDTPEPDLIIIL